MINKMMIPHIEKALDIRLYSNVIESLTTQNRIEWNGRRCGKTLAYMIKLALNDEKEIKLNELRLGYYCDEVRDIYYRKWFTAEFLKVRRLLKEYGFKVVDIN